MRRLCLLLALVLLLAPMVRADVIYVPEDNFRAEHPGECEDVGKVYETNGPNNEVVIYKSPESAVVEGRLPNGEGVHVYYSYTDHRGNPWGYVETDAGCGWIPMVYLVHSYGNVDFLVEFYERVIWLDKWLKADVEGLVRFWAYPGSEHWAEVELSAGEQLLYGRRFVDDGGRTWVDVGDYASVSCGWVCLDAPGASYSELYAEIPPQSVTTEEVPEHPRIPVVPSTPGMGGVLTMVCVVALLSGGFLLLKWNKKG